ncbi:MAG: hypothetical protein E6649_05345 [Paeniclostridium sordellii]|nr:hypothetical protein [Paeniclostridium sordellii]DAP48628.1 MAG TPA: head to tail adaptor [Caudoviricetes sp.]
MLENIKMLLGLSDDKYDQLILYQINKITNKVLSYCNIKDLNPTLEGFIEEKVYNIMRDKVNGNNEVIDNSSNNVKAITRGDTRIEYNVSEVKTEVLGPTEFDSNDIKILNQFRKLRK